MLQFYTIQMVLLYMNDNCYHFNIKHAMSYLLFILPFCFYTYIIIFRISKILCINIIIGVTRQKILGVLIFLNILIKMGRLCQFNPLIIFKNVFK